MLYELSVILSSNSFKHITYMLKIISTFSKLFPQKAVKSMHVNILIKHKQLYLVTNKYFK